MTPRKDVTPTRGKFEVGVHAVYRLNTCDLGSVRIHAIFHVDRNQTWEVLGVVGSQG